MNRLSLNSDGAFRTMIHKRTPHAKNRTSTVKEKKQIIEPINLINHRFLGMELFTTFNFFLPGLYKICAIGMTSVDMHFQRNVDLFVFFFFNS